MYLPKCLHSVLVEVGDIINNTYKFLPNDKKNL